MSEFHSFSLHMNLFIDNTRFMNYLALIFSATLQTKAVPVAVQIITNAEREQEL